MLSYFLVIHNLFRWIILLMAIYILYNNYTGWKGGRVFAKKDKIMNTIFVGFMDLQLIIGLCLYFFFSNITKMAFANMGEAMKDKLLRFWTVEHLMGMLAAIVVAHIGSALSKKAATDPEKYRKAFIYFTITILIIIISLPYAMHGGERPINPFENIQ